MLGTIEYNGGHDGRANGRRRYEEGAAVFVEFDVLYCSREETVGNGAAAAEMCVFLMERGSGDCAELEGGHKGG
jgi:hypothetical protein